ncbi:MAG: gamma-glutamyl-gamma-aminobutyrate hydrolase family protein [Planctomycetes bacterium]|nr:gamma-glutamyl-gamma-aminobutyrate hydrolase family protein [Planctomycetota bacterium]MBM4083594.1 gamma-glutamyl-gamma-aminobutyrate hydrolase family protein [Planctomycetota bacterium]
MKPLIGITCSFKPDGRGQTLTPAAYHDAVQRAGGAPILLPPLEADEDIAELLRRLDGLLLSGGPDINPVRYGEEKHEKTMLLAERREHFDLKMAAAAIAAGVPTLGVCLGAQEVNVACRGSLIQDIPSLCPGALVHAAPTSGGGETMHEVTIEQGSRLHRILGVTRLSVNSSHHQAARQPGQRLKVCARCDDGIVEALEGDDESFVLAIQWHPERIVDLPKQLDLFRALVDAARLRCRAAHARCGGG